ncbi:hypothetical protein SAMN05216388_10454 [Halorientalis persicus]|uniref:Uncharacterized protein n=1 Tax=Halorientalis persicus TaxID=1367881 RepID=A0A1H8VZQ6_9EURY|nr:hypothetical protein SAMN05216388_10454 [Halorientalis persicus]
MAKVKSVIANPGESADSWGGRFAEWAMLTPHALRIKLGKSYRFQVLKSTTLLYVRTLNITDTHSTVSKKHG